MVTLTQIETQARMLDHQADAMAMLARSLRWGAKAHAEGKAQGLREAAASLRRLEDMVIWEEADYFDRQADVDLSEMKEEAAERADESAQF